MSWVAAETVNMIIEEKDSTITRLRERVKLLESLVEETEGLLCCYKVGGAKNAGRHIDKIRSLKQTLREVEGDTRT